MEKGDIGTWLTGGRMYWSGQLRAERVLWAGFDVMWRKPTADNSPDLCMALFSRATGPMLVGALRRTNTPLFGVRVWLL